MILFSESKQPNLEGDDDYRLLTFGNPVLAYLPVLNPEFFHYFAERKGGGGKVGQCAVISKFKLRLRYVINDLILTRGVYLSNMNVLYVFKRNYILVYNKIDDSYTRTCT